MILSRGSFVNTADAATNQFLEFCLFEIENLRLPDIFICRFYYKIIRSVVYYSRLEIGFLLRK